MGMIAPKDAFGEKHVAPMLARRWTCLRKRLVGWWCDAKVKLNCEKGQGTTEYAILVGVLVVVAILAISAFRPKVEELWNAISSGINSL